MTASLPVRLTTLAAQVHTWLTPTVQADCPHQESTKLRVFLANLEAARDMALIQDEGIDPVTSLSATLERLAEAIATWTRPVTLDAAAIKTLIAVINEAAGHAWALEACRRLAAGVAADVDLETLALARSLQRGKVTRANRLDAPKAARDVPPGTSWAFTDHRSMAQVAADEASGPSGGGDAA